jgi:Icc protein
MLIAQISDTHIKVPGKLAYNTVDTAQMLRDCVAHITQLPKQPDLIFLTGDLVDLGRDEEYAYLLSILAPLKQRIIAIPGNHDERDAMRRAFKSSGYLPDSGFLQFAIDGEYPFRIIGLDTLIPFAGGGELCAQRLQWLDQILQKQPDVPTVVLMHHPPFLTGIGHMDDIGLQGREEFAAIMARHPQVTAILCGHLHRTIHATVGGRPAMTSPSPAHQIVLDIDPAAPSHFCLEPPGYLLHWWNEGKLISHTALIGQYPGPYPFFSEDGKLID